MNGPIAQIVALTCFGNSFLGGHGMPKFFPANSTCQFCDSVKFVEIKKPFLGKEKEVLLADTPDEWIGVLKKRGAIGIRLGRTPQNDARISDRMSSAFVGGGGTWLMEVLRSDGKSEFWAARWEVWNQKAPERRIWRVTYGLVRQDQTKPYRGRDLATVKNELRAILESIHSFSARQDCEGFTKCFAEAIRALSDPSADIGYHKDLAVSGQLSPEAESVLKASMSAWVFGGMGSWNDIGFDGTAQQEYERVSEALFNILNDAIEVAATSSLKFWEPEGVEPPR